MKIRFALVALLLSLLVIPLASAQKPPVPLPTRLRVESSLPRIEVWKRLTDREKRLAYYLTEAAKAGKTLLFDQRHRHARVMRDVFVTSLTQNNIGATREILGERAFKEYLTYTAKFLDQHGPYGNNNRKSILTVAQPEQIETIFRTHAKKIKENDLHEILQLLCVADYEVLSHPEEDSDELAETGGNLYQKGITGAEVDRVLDKTLKPGLNCRVIKTPQGLTCERPTVYVAGFAGVTLRKIVRSLEQARIYSSTEHQKNQLSRLIEYFHTSELEDFRQMNVEWVKDRSASTADFMMGWVEVYDDPKGRIGSWETMISIVDPAVSKQAQAFAGFAQYYEDQMPYGTFKKTFPADYSPPAIMAYYFLEDTAMRSGGFNLPNFDDIRKNVGAKNVIKLDMPGEGQDTSTLTMVKEALGEYLPTAKLDEVLANRVQSRMILVMLHEIIGHGSGTYDESKYPPQADPISILGGLGSALEEERADLSALSFAGDKKLVEIGLVKNEALLPKARNSLYDMYLGDFLLRVGRLRNFTQTHTRGRWMFINKLLEAKAIAWVAKDGTSEPTMENQVLAVTNYDLYHKVAVEVLGELQRIKANRDEVALKALFEKYAPLAAINEPWAQAIIARGEPLLSNAGYVEQPWAITPQGKVEVYGGTTLESVAPFWAKFY